jgi:hypothetical protein
VKSKPKPVSKAKLQHDGYGYHITRKGYPRFNNSGPMKGMYVHRYEAAKKLGRPLKDDEQVHHGRGGKKDFSHENLTVMGSSEHGWVSARQAFWMKFLDIKQEQEFYQVITQLEQEGISTGL